MVSMSAKVVAAIEEAFAQLPTRDVWPLLIKVIGGLDIVAAKLLNEWRDTLATPTVFRKGNEENLKKLYRVLEVHNLSAWLRMIRRDESRTKRDIIDWWSTVTEAAIKCGYTVETIQTADGGRLWKCSGALAMKIAMNPERYCHMPPTSANREEVSHWLLLIEDSWAFTEVLTGECTEDMPDRFTRCFGQAMILP